MSGCIEMACQLELQEGGPNWCRMVVTASAVRLGCAWLGKRNRAGYAAIPVESLSGYEYGFKEGVPRLLDMFDRRKVRVTSHMVAPLSKTSSARQGNRPTRPRTLGPRADVDAAVFHDAGTRAEKLRRLGRNYRASHWQTARRLQCFLVARYAADLPRPSRFLQEH
jgi:hypothetical protein